MPLPVAGLAEPRTARAALRWLKELEALEKLVEKVGRIDMHTGGDGMGALLSKLYRLGAPDGPERGGKGDGPT